MVSAPQPKITRTSLTYTRSGGALRQGKIPAKSGMKIKLPRKNLLICALLSLRLTYLLAILRHASQMCQGLDLNSCFRRHFHSLDYFRLIENLARWNILLVHPGFQTICLEPFSNTAGELSVLAGLQDKQLLPN